MTNVIPIADFCSGWQLVTSNPRGVSQPFCRRSLDGLHGERVSESFSEKLQVPEALTFDDVLLRPMESRVEPDDADVSTRVSKTLN